MSNYMFVINYVPNTFQYFSFYSDTCIVNDHVFLVIDEENKEFPKDRIIFSFSLRCLIHKEL